MAGCSITLAGTVLWLAGAPVNHPAAAGIWLDEEAGWHRCTGTGSGIHSTASLTKTIQIRLSAVSIMVGVANYWTKVYYSRVFITSRGAVQCNDDSIGQKYFAQTSSMRIWEKQEELQLDPAMLVIICQARQMTWVAIWMWSLQSTSEHGEPVIRTPSSLYLHSSDLLLVVKL